MNWLELCNRPDLQNLPFKIELNKQGKVIMSPVKVYHSTQSILFPRFPQKINLDA